MPEVLKCAEKKNFHNAYITLFLHLKTPPYLGGFAISFKVKFFNQTRENILTNIKKTNWIVYLLNFIIIIVCCFTFKQNYLVLIGANLI